MLRFVSGRIKNGKTTYLIEKIKNNPAPGTLFIVPEHYSHSMERLLCKICGNSVSAYAEVTSFRRLMTKVKSETGGFAVETVGGGKRILLLHSAICAVAPSLGTLAKTAERPERLAEILSAIDEFKAYGITPEALSRVSGDVSKRCGEKLCDLAKIYAAYENELGEDAFDAYDELAYTAESVRRSGFFKDKTLYLDGFSGFTHAEFDIIEAALSDARDVYIALELPESEEKGEENGIFDKTIDTKKKIYELAARTGTEIEEIRMPEKKSGAIGFLDRALFAAAPKKYDGDASTITVARADGVFAECELAAGYILDGVRKNGLRYRDFSVAVTSSAEYLSTCEMVFSRYGIPVYVTVPDALSAKPAIAVILAALDCIMRGFKTDAVMEYIKTGFSGICSKTLNVFENYLYMWSPRASMWYGGREFTKNPFGLNATESDESRALLRVVNCARRKIYEPIAALEAAMRRGKTGEKCAEALYDFINRINLPRRCNAYAYMSERLGRLSDAQEYERVTAILYDAIDSIGRAVGDEETDIEQFYLLFKTVISQYELDTIPPSLDCVSVGEVSRTDGERCGVRIILGANDGSLPSVSDSVGILTDKDRLELSDYGIELAPGAAERVFEQFRTTHNVICSAEKALYISSSTIGEKGDENPEAAVVSRIRSCFNGMSKALTVTEARLRAKTPCFDESVASGKGVDIWRNDEAFGERLCIIEQNSRGKRGPIINKENIEAIFGKKIRLSASKVDLFSNCRYAYFLKYGLFAREREKAEMDVLQSGTLMHDILENVLRKLSAEGNFDEKRAVFLAEEALHEYVSASLSGDDEISKRTQFLLSRLEKTAKATLVDICREQQKSRFFPHDFELEFAPHSEGLPPIEVKGENSTVLFRGAVDRIDTFEEDGKLYFRVIDYKSGRKDFSLDEVLNGIGMQMLLYMFAIEDMSEQHFGKPATPTGVMYIPISRPFASASGDAPKPVKRKGVILRDMAIIEAMENGKKEYVPVKVNKDGSLSEKDSKVLTETEFERVKLRMKEILADVGDELNRGEIEPNPFDGSCQYCKYKAVCAFDDERTEDCLRELFEVSKADILDEKEDAE